MAKLSLTSFEAGIDFVDHVKTAFAANNFAIFVSFFSRLNRVKNFHETPTFCE
jgi:hypothetical protein